MNSDMQNRKLYIALLWASVVLNCCAASFSLWQSIRVEFAVREAQRMMATFQQFGW